MPCCTKDSPASRCFPNQKQNAIRDSADGAVVHVFASEWERAGSGELAGSWRLQRWPTAGFLEGAPTLGHARHQVAVIVPGVGRATLP